MGTRLNNLNQDLEGNENNEDKAYTGSITELSMNEKMEKPMLPPLEYLSSVHSTQHQSVPFAEQRTGSAGVATTIQASDGRNTRTVISRSRDKSVPERAVTQAMQRRNKLSPLSVKFE